MDQPPLGDQELAIWRYIAEHAPLPARAVADWFAQERGLARTTILTVIERLRKKGYLTRRPRDGVYHYSPRVPPGEVVQGVVRQFVERTLAGSVSPLVAYLANVRTLSDEELAELQRLVDELKSEKDAEHR